MKHIKRGALWIAKELDASAPEPSPFEVLGETGLREYSGTVTEEWHQKLRGRQGIRIYKEMSDNDAIIGSILYAIDSLVRGVTWDVQPADDSEAATQQKEFLETCRDDMAQSWNDLISEVLTMLIFGWSYFELVYKMRRGPDQEDSRLKSAHNDGKIGWRKISIRAQETLNRWYFQEDGGIAGLEQTLPNGGFACIPIEKALLFRTRSHKNNPEGYSILRRAFRSWFIKKRLEEIEAIGIERDLAGLPVLEVPPEMLISGNASDVALRNELLNLVSQVRRDEREGIIVPAQEDANGKTGYKFSLMTSGGTRAIAIGDTIKRHESRMAMSALAEMIMLGIDGGGNRALGESKIDLFLLSLESFLGSIEAVLNRFAVPRLMQMNGVPRELWPTFAHSSLQKADSEKTAEAVVKLVSAGALDMDQTLKDYLREDNGFPMPEMDAEQDAQLPQGGVQASAAFAPGQIEGLTGIVEKVAEGRIPREAGVQLIVATFPFNEAQAIKILATVGTPAFTPTLAEAVSTEIGEPSIEPEPEGIEA